jgi:hypothetical protein
MLGGFTFILCASWVFQGKNLCRTWRWCDRREAERRLNHVCLLMPGWMLMLEDKRRLDQQRLSGLWWPGGDAGPD